MAFPPMNHELALLLKLMHQQLDPLLPRSVLRSFLPLVRRAEEVLQAEELSSLTRWLRRVRALAPTPPFVPKNIPARVLDAVLEALRLHRCIEGRYLQPGQRSPLNVRVHPSGILLRLPSVILLGSLEKPTEVYQFHLHRFTAARLGPVNPRHPQHIDIDGFLAQRQPLSPKDALVRVHLRVKVALAARLQEAPLSKDQSLSHHSEGWLSLRASVLDSRELRHWILGHGPSVEVLAPRTLREAIMERAKQTVELYQL